MGTGTKNKFFKLLSSYHFWVLLILFAIGIILHYPQQILKISSPSVFSSIGLVRHAIERIYLLIPIAYASFFLGTPYGFVSVLTAVAIMLPRVFFISEYFPDALFETIAVIIIGTAESWWFAYYRSEKRERQKMMTNLEASFGELQTYTEELEKDDSRLGTLNQISNTISQSLEIKKILENAIEAVIRTLKVDAVWIYLLDEEMSVLNLAAHRDFNEEFARIESGQGISGRVLETGLPEIVEDASSDARLPPALREMMASVVVVPLTAKGKVIGTMGVSSQSKRKFAQPDTDLLLTIGNQIGVAIENARLYQTQLEVSRKLSVSERKYRELFENAQDAIWLHDMEGNITAANKATVEMIGRDSKDLIGLNAREFLSEESLLIAALVKRKLMSGQPIEQPYEQILIKKNGNKIIIKLTTNLITGNSEPDNFLCIARDVTQERETQNSLKKAFHELSESHRKLEESQEQLIAMEKLTSLGKLSASVAHEVNNPIAGILVYNQLLIKKLKTDKFEKEEALDFLSKMEKELVRIGRLIQNLLDFARQTGPRLSLININDVLERALSLVAHTAQLQHINIIKEFSTSLPLITADGDQLNQVFINLMMNSIQAMPLGGTMTIFTSFENGRIGAAIQDTGVGISKENMGNLFTPFFSTKKEVKGVGLGLAVSHGIIERHRGKIEVKSEEGKGSTFTVYLNRSEN